jgi:hypothetical protein
MAAVEHGGDSEAVARFDFGCFGGEDGDGSCVG